jgi:type IV secretory pathway TrbL component
MTKAQKLLAIPVIGAITMIGGAVAGYAGLASAQSTDASATTTTSSPPQQMTNGTNPHFDSHQGGHIGANGVKEVLLTGDAATKATVAAIAAVPGGTIERVETDAEGAAYEAHMTKSDGSRVTVKMDANFNVTSTEAGPNFGGPGSLRGNATQNSTNR